MTLQTRLGLSDVPNAAASPEVIVNQNDVALSLFTPTALGFANAPAGGEVEGDFYIVSTAPSGSFASFTTDNLAVLQNGAWVEVTAIDRMAVWVENAGDSDLYKYDAISSPQGWVLTSVGGGGGASTQVYDIPAAQSGTPDPGAAIARYHLPRAVDIPANMSGSAGGVETNPTAGDYVISIRDDGVEIGSATISTAGAVTFATTSGTSKVIAAGSKVEFVAPSDSPTETVIAGISITIKASTTDV